MPVRIAMWSGPRNLSTALMRAFENRSDTWVSDEPLYAHYLDQTGLNHPGAEDVIASQPTEWALLTRRLAGPPPQGRHIWFQKHMAHHLLPGCDQDWIAALTNCLLIRDPREVVASYTEKRGHATLSDLGYPQQIELFETLRARTGEPPLVIDAKDVLTDPRGALSRLCEAMDIPFDEAMLSWPPGPRSTDGVWGRHWYQGVWNSTGFQPHRPKAPVYDSRFERVVEAATPLYAFLSQYRLR